MTNSSAVPSENKSSQDPKAIKIQAAFDFYVQHYLAETDAKDPGQILLSSKFKDFFLKFDLAYDFYLKNKYTPDAIPGHLSGIDFTKEVKLTSIQAGSRNLYQFQPPVSDVKAEPRQGDYYAEAGLTPTSLGISPQAVRHWLNETTPIDKSLNEYKIVSQTMVLESTAKAIKDTWSIPKVEIMTEGGARQYFCGEKDAFKFVRTLALDQLDSLVTPVVLQEGGQKAVFATPGNGV